MSRSTKKTETVGEMSVDDMQNMFANLMKPLNDSVSKLKKEVTSLRKEVEVLSQELTKKDEEISRLETVVMQGLEEREQYSRRNNVRIFGIKESDEEDTDKLVIDLAAKMTVKISKHHIDRSHRVGKAGDVPRPIIVRFVSYAERRAVFSSKKSLKGSGVTIREDLTRIRLDILKRAIAKYSSKSVWSSDGVILVNVGKARPFRIKTESDFKKLMDKHPPTES